MGAQPARVNQVHVRAPMLAACHLPPPVQSFNDDYFPVPCDMSRSFTAVFRWAEGLDQCCSRQAGRQAGSQPARGRQLCALHVLAPLLHSEQVQQLAASRQTRQVLSLLTGSCH